MFCVEHTLSFRFLRGRHAGDSGVLRALKRLLLKRRAGLESHLRDVAHEAVRLGSTTRCRKVRTAAVGFFVRACSSSSNVKAFFAAVQWSCTAQRKLEGVTQHSTALHKQDARISVVAAAVAVISYLARRQRGKHRPDFVFFCLCRWWWWCWLQKSLLGARGRQ